MKWSSNTAIVQNIFIKTILYKNDQKGKAILFLLKNNNIHLINTISNLSTFCLTKSLNFNAEIEVFDWSLSHLMFK